MIYNRLIIVFICLLSIKTFSQKLSNLTTNNVIEDSVINTVYIDTENNTWICSKNGGLSKFDGYEWMHMDSPDKSVGYDIRGVDEDLQKYKWFASYGTGVTRYGLWPLTGSRKPYWTFFTYNSSNNPDTSIVAYDGYNTFNYINSKQMLTNNINCILVDAINKKWFGTEGFGVIQLSGTSYSNYAWVAFSDTNGLANNTVNSMDFSTSNRWFATNGGLSLYDNTNWYKFNHLGKSIFNSADSTWSIVDASMFISDTIINFVKTDANGRIWLATDNGVYSFDNTTFTKYTTADGLISNSVNYISTDNANNIYFVSSTGIAIYNLITYNWQTINTSADFTCNNVLSITADNNGHYWIGTDNGLYFYDGIVWTNYKKSSILGSNNIWATATDIQNAKWFGTYGGGLFKYLNNQWTNYNTNNGLADSIVVSIAVDNSNNKWCGTSKKGLSKFNGTSFTNYNTYDGLASNSIYSIKFESNGDAWLGTVYGDGVSKMTGNSFTNYNYTNGLAFNDVRAIAIDTTGTKWFGTYGGGISKFNGTSWVTLDETSGLVGNYIQAIAIDKNGKKWIGTTNGLSAYNDTVFINYYTSISIWDIKVDENNIVWVCTWGSGLKKFDGTSWVSYETKWNSANIIQGLADNRVNSITIDLEGVKYIATWKGLTILQDGGAKNYDIVQKSNFIVNQLADINIYPIPVNSELNIEYNPINSRNCSIEIFDILGNKIKSEQINTPTTSIKLNNLEKGVYLLRLTDGLDSYNQKIVKN